jgi:hypothetical protein
MIRTLGWILAVLLSASATSLRAQDTLDLLPKNTLLSLSVRNLDELREKGDKLYDAVDLKVPRPSGLFNQLLDILGIRDGLDRKKPMAVMMLAPEAGMRREFLPGPIAALVPYKDLDEMADNFGIGKGKLKKGQVAEGRGKAFGSHFGATDSHVLLGDKDAVVQGVLKSKKFSELLPAAKQKQFNASDILLASAVPAWGRDLDDFAGELERNAKRLELDTNPTVKQLLKAARETQTFLMGVQVGNGLGGNFLTTFPAKGDAADFLKELRTGVKACDLKGLPVGNVVAAQSQGGEGAKTAPIASLMFDLFYRWLMIEQKLISPNDRANFLGVFEQVWQRLDGSRMALYFNADEVKHGTLSLVAILDSDDPAQFLREIKILARIADGTLADLNTKEAKELVDINELIKNLGATSFRAREAAATKLRLIGEPALPYLKQADKVVENDLETVRRAQKLYAQIDESASVRRKELLHRDAVKMIRPTFRYIGGAEKRGEQSVDVIQMKLADEKAGFQTTLKSIFGGDWDRLRVGVVGKKIVVLVGSDTALLDAAVSNLSGGKDGLHGLPSLADYRKHAAPGAVAEFHVSSEAFALLAGLAPKGPAPASAPTLTSFGLTIGADSLQLDMWLPVRELRTMVERSGFLGFR